ncbi:sensor histidine kinase [Bacillus sp. FJAT-52991]|uniref:histidine kinase n=1 Tax=Bacillus kandeliae TaxID=3129297 RepID=A0ABZ2NCR0_9BACI
MVIKNRKVMAIFIFTVYIALHIYLIIQIVQPFSGITISMDRHQNVIVEQIDKDGWVHDTNISKGDIVKKIEGKEVKGLDDQKRLEHAEDLTIEHNNKITRYTAPDIKFSNFLKELYMPEIFTILILLLSILIYQKHNSTANFLMSFLMMSSLSLLTSNVSGHKDVGASLILIFSFQLGVLSFFCFIYSTFLEKDLIRKKPSVILTINIIFGIFIILLNIYDLLIKDLPSLLTDNLMLVHFSLNIVYSIGFLIYLYIKKRDSSHEPFLKWMLVIPTIAFVPFIFLHAIPYILGLPILPDDIAALFLFAIPIGYSYLILTKQLLDINFILNRIRYYTFLSLVPTIIISFVVSGTVNYDSNLFSRFLQNFFLIFTLNVIFLLLKEKIDYSFRNQLFRDKTNLTQSIDQFTQKLSAVMKEEELERLLVNEVVSVLNPSVIAFVEYDSDTFQYTTRVFHGNEELFTLHKHQEWLIQSDTSGDLLKYTDSLGIRLYNKDQKMVYIWVGHKRNHTSFNINEKTWTTTIVKYVRLVYENLHAVSDLIQSLQQQDIEDRPASVSLSRFLFQLAETERRRLASDLHDSALQDQIVWYRKLEHLIQDNQDIPSDVQEQLIKVKNGMVDVIKQIRSTCNELRPNLLLEGGLIQSLKELFSQFQMRVKYHLDYEFDNISETFEDYNTKLSIYRVFQELLNNADKHSKATHVSVSMWEDDQMIYIDYRDNGKGFDMQSPYIKKNHMGLSVLKERIFSLNGEVEFVSSKGKGLQVHITIPR